MQRVFDFRLVQALGGWPSGARELLGDGVERVTKEGGRFWGLWVGQIGLASNEGIVLVEWGPPQARPRRLGGWLETSRQVATLDQVLLDPVALPGEENPPASCDGIYTFRWFTCREGDWEEFVRLSLEAWPGYQDRFQASVLALFRSDGAEAGLTRSLMVTRYPDLSAWERSRHDFDSESDRAVRERFLRRNELTLWTRVVTTSLATQIAQERRLDTGGLGPAS